MRYLFSFTFSKYLFIDVEDLSNIWSLKQRNIGNNHILCFIPRIGPHSFQCLIRNVTAIKIIVCIQSILFLCTIKSFGCAWSCYRAMYSWFKGGIEQFCPWCQSKDAYLIVSRVMCTWEKCSSLYKVCKAPTSSHNKNITVGQIEEKMSLINP